jgi:hypothetical protein
VNIIGAQADSDGSLDPRRVSLAVQKRPKEVTKFTSLTVACTKLSHRSIVVQDPP